MRLKAAWEMASDSGREEALRFSFLFAQEQGDCGFLPPRCSLQSVVLYRFPCECGHSSAGPRGP